MAPVESWGDLDEVWCAVLDLHLRVDRAVGDADPGARAAQDLGRGTSRARALQRGGRDDVLADEAGELRPHHPVGRLDEHQLAVDQVAVDGDLDASDEPLDDHATRSRLRRCPGDGRGEPVVRGDVLHPPLSLRVDGLDDAGERHGADDGVARGDDLELQTRRRPGHGGAHAALVVARLGHLAGGEGGEPQPFRECADHGHGEVGSDRVHEPDAPLVHEPSEGVDVEDVDPHELVAAVGGRSVGRSGAHHRVEAERPRGVDGILLDCGGPEDEDAVAAHGVLPASRAWADSSDAITRSASSSVRSVCSGRLTARP